MKTCKVFHVWVEGFGRNGARVCCANCGMSSLPSQAPFLRLAKLLGNFVEESAHDYELWADVAAGANEERLRSKQ